MKFHYLLDTGSEAPRRDARSEAVRGGAGLVTIPTSGTPDSPIEVDPFLTRLRKLRRSVITAAGMHEYELLGKRSR